MGAAYTKAEWTTADLLAAAKQLSPAELGEFQRRLSAWRRQTNGADPAVAADADEATLLAQIRESSSLPVPEQRRFDRLRRKRQPGQLSQTETNDLQAVWQRVEEMNVERLRALCVLARLRGTDLDTLQRELGLGENRRVL